MNKISTRVHKRPTWFIAWIILTLAIAFLMNSTPNAEADTVGRIEANDLKFSYYYSLTGTAPYIRYVNKNEGKVYDLTNDTLSATATWIDTDIALEDKMSTIGGWQIPDDKIPPEGTYDVLLYDVSVAAGSRSSSDEVARGKHAKVSGGVLRIVTLSDI